MAERRDQEVDHLSKTPGWTAVVVPAVVAVSLTAIGFHDFALFHSLTELFVIGVAVLMTVVAWHTYPFSRNGFLMFLACGFFWIGAADMVHTLVHNRMTIPGSETQNPAMQSWLVARGGQAALMLAAPLFAKRDVPRWTLFIVFGAIFAGIHMLVATGLFPAVVDGRGPTPFETASEYAIIAVYVAALGHLYLRRADLRARTVRLITASLVLTIGSALVLTFNGAFRGEGAVVGHMLKLLAYWLIYEAVIRDSLVEPYRFLEARVRQRTRALEEEMTRREKAERDIRRSESWLRSVIDNLPDMVTVKDRAGNYLLVNKEFERFWGKTREEVLGRPPEEVLTADATANMRAQHADVILSGEACRREHRDTGSDGTIHDLTSLRFPITDASGHIVAVGNFTTDVTERKRSEEQVQHAQKIQALGDLAGGISHEINNLLVPVVTLSNALMKRLPDDDPHLQPLSLIHDAGLRARDIVAQILAFSRQDQIEQEEGDIGAMLQVPLELIRSTAPPSLTLNLDVPAKAGAVVADAGQLSTVLVNVVSNAIDSLEGGPGRGLGELGGGRRRGSRSRDRRPAGARGGLRAAPGDRFRPRHGQRDGAPDLRPLLLDQGGGAGHRARAFHRPRHRQRPSRRHRRRQYPGRRHPDRRLHSAGGRNRRQTAGKWGRPLARASAKTA